MIRPMLALYIGGMGARGDATSTSTCSPGSGYEAEATQIQELYLAGKKDEAIAAVPTRWSRTSRSSVRRTRSATTSPRWKETGRHHDARVRAGADARGHGRPAHRLKCSAD